ncbi:hypothetical protein HRbin33_00390 [bacterium HR33]|nr:hypothetical protein HRbin33_00390 [bacterium HR33]
MNRHRQKPLGIALLGCASLLIACESNPENSPACGIASIAAASIVLQSMQDLNKLVTDPPVEVPNPLPARVVGYGTSSALVATGPEGLILGYQGEGFPRVPGFGLLLVDDSTEAVRGVLVYEPEGPPNYPKLGTISGSESTLPLYGVRVHWPSVNTPRCPLFAPLKTDAQPN